MDGPLAELAAAVATSYDYFNASKSRIWLAVSIAA